jgi:integrase
MAKRRSQFGQARRLPSGRWQARYTVPGTGRRQTAPQTFDTAMDARAWLKAVGSDMHRGRWRAPESSPTFGAYAERWLTERDLKPRTAAHYRRLADKFLLPAFGGVAVDAITPESVRTWHALLRTGPTYKAHAYSLLRTILRTCVDDGLIGVSPAVIRGAGKAKRARTIKPANLDELQIVVNEMPPRLRLMVLLAAWCALRFGEIAELRRADVDLRTGVIHVRRGVTWVDGEEFVGRPKSEAGVRDVAIPPHLIPAVKAHLRDHAGLELVFPSPRGRHLTSTMLYEHWWPARQAADRPDLRFHDLRHTGAVLAAQSGATLKELMARLGHSTPAMALEYQHAAASRDQAIAAKLSELADGRSR